MSKTRKDTVKAYLDNSIIQTKKKKSRTSYKSETKKLVRECIR